MPIIIHHIPDSEDCIVPPSMLYLSWRARVTKSLIMLFGRSLEHAGPLDYPQRLSSPLRQMQRNTRTIAAAKKSGQRSFRRLTKQYILAALTLMIGPRFLIALNAILPAVTEPDIMEISTRKSSAVRSMTSRSSCGTPFAFNFHKGS